MFDRALALLKDLRDNVGEVYSAGLDGKSIETKNTPSCALKLMLVGALAVGTLAAPDNANAQDMFSAFANNASSYINNGVRDLERPLMYNTNDPGYNNPGYYSQQGVINRAKVGAAASVANLAAGFPGEIMNQRNIRLAHEQQQIQRDQAEFNRTGIMSPNMMAAYDKHVAEQKEAQDEADAELTPQQLAEVKQLRAQGAAQEDHLRQQNNPNYRGQNTVAQNPQYQVHQGSPTQADLNNILQGRNPNAAPSDSDRKLLADQQTENAALLDRLHRAQARHQQLLQEDQMRRQGVSPQSSFQSTPPPIAMRLPTADQPAKAGYDYHKDRTYKGLPAPVKKAFEKDRAVFEVVHGKPLDFRNWMDEQVSASLSGKVNAFQAHMAKTKDKSDDHVQVSYKSR